MNTRAQQLAANQAKKDAGASATGAEASNATADKATETTTTTAAAEGGAATGEENKVSEGAQDGGVQQESAAGATDDAVASDAPAAGATEGTEAAASETPAAEQAPVVTSTTLEAAAGAVSSGAATRGTIAPPSVRVAPTSTAPVALALPKTNAVAATAAAAEPALLDEVNRILADVPDMHRFPILGVLSYCEKADLKVGNTQESMAKLNVTLWHNITNLINNQDEYFTPMFTALLRIFALAGRPDGPLSEIAINRGSEYMALSRTALQGYFKLTTMLRLTADPKSRKMILKSSLDLPKALKDGLTQEGVNRVVTYFETA